MLNRIISIFCGILFIISLVFYPMYNINRYEKQCLSDYPLLNFTIVLDAGHGGTDGGAIGIKTLVKEKEINLSIVKKLSLLFQSSGATVILTRKNDDALCKGKFNKMEDMNNRVEVINRSKPYIVISVHCNSFPQDKSVLGAQMFYYPDSESGKLLAENIQNSLNSFVNTDKKTARQENFFMLRNGNSTNVMIECGFLSNYQEETNLITEEHQDKIAYSIFDGTNKYITKILAPNNI